MHEVTTFTDSAGTTISVAHAGKCCEVFNYGYTSAMGIHKDTPAPEATFLHIAPKTLARHTPHGATLGFALSDGSELIISLRRKCNDHVGKLTFLGKEYLL